MPEFEVVFYGRDFIIFPVWDKDAQQELRKPDASPAKPALPPGATRHKAISQACLTLPDAACFMRGIR